MNETLLPTPPPKLWEIGTLNYSSPKFAFKYKTYFIDINMKKIKLHGTGKIKLMTFYVIQVNECFLPQFFIKEINHSFLVSFI